MSFAALDAIQAPLVTLARAALVGQAPGGGDVPIFDHVPEDADRMHVRFEGEQAVRYPMKGVRLAYNFAFHVFDHGRRGGDIARGLSEVKRLAVLIAAALDGQTPSGVTGAGPVRIADLQTFQGGRAQEFEAILRGSVIIF